MYGNKKYTLEILIEITKISNPNIEILGEYNKIVGKTKKRNERRIKCRCLIDNYEFEKSVNELVTGVGCRKCADKANSERQSFNINYIKEQLKVLNPTVEILSTEYVNARTPLKCRCLIHNCIFESRYDDLRKGKGCRLCKSDKLSKENNPNWQGGISPLSNYLRDKLIHWKQDSFKKYNYKCAITGIHNNLIIHHLYGFSKILEETMHILNLPIHKEINQYSEDELKQIEDKCLELHYKYGLGICICSKVHNSFHKKYGQGNNNPEQWNEFKQKYLMAI